MRIGLLQFAPDFTNVSANTRKASSILDASQLHPGSIDLLILPELAFAGYVFPDKAAIEPFIEHSDAGPTFAWAHRTAREMQCHVQVGLARAVEASDGAEVSWRNSVIVVGPQGQLVAVYDKHFLYEVDERWATEGPGFQAIQLLDHTVGLGICMDLNPYKFQSPFEAFEFANFHVNSGSELISCSMAWVLSKADAEKGLKTVTPIVGTLNYWAARLSPLIDTTKGDTKRIIFAVCNRTGGENGTDFCGSSCVLEFSGGGASLLGVLGHKEEALLIINTEEH
ncbi:N-terminal asparagine amidohydrolase-like protein [Chytriomyces sp. MP71]|nr:N-terminal asparagine amidohydrolase-like protein [Chytriomyces sp. MP71]